MKRKAIIFGSGGQDGLFLHKYLLTLGYQVFPFTHHGSEFGPALDVADFQNVSKIIKEVRPHYIFNLAAHSSTRHEFIFENQRAIVDGALSILESADKYSQEANIFLASSGLVFDNRGAPIKETDSFVTNSAYALARLEALQVARYYRQRGRKVFVGFLFNHESPFRPPQSVARMIARSVAEVHLGLNKYIRIGNVNVTKEWMWAGDAVSAMVQIVNQDEIFEVCIGDGIGRTVRDYAMACCEVVGISLEDYLVELPAYQVQYTYLVSDSSKMRTLGWAPEVSFDSLAKIMVESEIRSSL